MDTWDDPFSLTVEDDGQHVVVFLSGELDIATAPQLHECLTDFARRSITLDFSGVTFMDSSGVAALVAALRQRSNVVLRGVGPVQRVVLEATGLAEQFHFEDL
jgi:anti-anti-sigma factor